MPNIKNFDPRMVQLFNQEMVAALQKVGERHGVSVTVGKIKYNTGTLKAVIHASLIDGPTITYEDTLQQELRANGYKYGLYQRDIGKRFIIGINVFTFVGLKPGARKTPIIAKSIIDKKYYRLDASAAYVIKRAEAVTPP